MNKPLPGNTIVHGLWIGNQLRPPEILCIRSFQQHGHTFTLWTYGPVDGVPAGTIIRDARNILPESSVFAYHNTNKFGHGKGSYAGFSDIFRYRLLNMYGGWWTDMDVTCLKALDFADNYVFRLNGDKGVVGNLMKCPAGDPLMDYCFKRAVNEIGPDNRDWLLPIRILNEGITRFELTKYCRNISNPDSWPLVSRYVIGQPKIPEHWYALHWMNEEWRRCGLDKEIFIEGSAIESFMNEHHVDHTIYPRKEAIRLRLKLGRLYYILINLVASVKWWVRFLARGGKQHSVN